MLPETGFSNSSRESLHEALVRGSAVAFAALVEQHSRKLYQYFRLLGRDQHEADDGVQETFLRLYAYRSQLRKQRVGELGGLLYRIARNVWIDSLRRARTRPPLQSLERSSAAAELVGSQSPGLDGALDARWALVNLPAKLRDVVLLCVFQGLSQREAAEALRIPVGTVKSRRLLAMKRLREVFNVPSK